MTGQGVSRVWTLLGVAAIVVVATGLVTAPPVPATAPAACDSCTARHARFVHDRQTQTRDAVAKGTTP